MNAVPATKIKETFAMMNKEEFEKYFTLHNKIVLYTKDNIPITISKEYHLHLEGGHCSMDIGDCEDLADFCKKRGLYLKPSNIQ
ncbi:MAG: hypothetical protein RR355_02340 [Oscillospiraceae bacterium]